VRGVRAADPIAAAVQRGVPSQRRRQLRPTRQLRAAGQHEVAGPQLESQPPGDHGGASQHLRLQYAPSPPRQPWAITIELLRRSWLHTRPYGCRKASWLLSEGSSQFGIS
jgi:hypothetical protein